MNLPNSITISRIATVPLLIWILSPHFPHSHATSGLAGGEQEVVARLGSKDLSGFLKKPYEPAELTEALHRALEHRVA